MNIFILDNDVKLSAKYHCNKHVVKMILESGQLLCTAHWLSMMSNDLTPKQKKLEQQKLQQELSVQAQPPWKMTHSNHPCAIWTRQTVGNYMYVLSLMRELLNEYTRRYHKIHKAETTWAWLSENKPKSYIQNDYRSMTPHVICMQDITCKIENDAVTSYRRYYQKHKLTIAKWEPHAKMPDWFLREEIAS